MSKLMQIDHADRALANARHAEMSDTVDSTAVAMTEAADCGPVPLLDHVTLKAARAIVRGAKTANAEPRDRVRAGLLKVTFLAGLTVGDAKAPGIQHAITQHGRTWGEDSR